MQSKVALRIGRSSVALALVWAAVGAPAYAIAVMAQSDSASVTTFTFQNLSPTQSAQVIFTIEEVISAQTLVTGTGSAFASFSGMLENNSLLLQSSSVTAPPSQTLVLTQQSFTFNIAPLSTDTLISRDEIMTEASASSPGGSATAIISISAADDFFNNSMASVLFSVSSVGSYTLSLSGVSLPSATGLASVSANDSLIDELTTNGMITAPVVGTASLILGPGEHLFGAGTGGNVAQATVPEPATWILIATCALGLLGWRRRLL